MGTGISHSENIDAINEKRAAIASKDRDVDFAIKIEWSDTGTLGAEKMSGVKVSLDRVPMLENWIIGKIKKDGKHKSLSIILDLGRGFKDTRFMPTLTTTIDPIIQPLTLSGCTVASIKVTGEFDTTMTYDQRITWWKDFVRLSNHAGLRYELNAKYQLDPFGIDQISIDHIGGNLLLNDLVRVTM